MWWNLHKEGFQAIIVFNCNSEILRRRFLLLFQGNTKTYERSFFKKESNRRKSKTILLYSSFAYVKVSICLSWIAVMNPVIPNIDLEKRCSEIHLYSYWFSKCAEVIHLCNLLYSRTPPFTVSVSTDLPYCLKRLNKTMVHLHLRELTTRGSQCICYVYIAFTISAFFSNCRGRGRLGINPPWIFSSYCIILLYLGMRTNLV